MLRLGEAWRRVSSLVGTWGRLTLLEWGAALSDANTLLVLSSHTQLLCLALQTHGENLPLQFHWRIPLEAMRANSVSLEDQC